MRDGARRILPQAVSWAAALAISWPHVGKADATTPCSVVEAFDRSDLDPSWREAVVSLGRDLAQGPLEDCRRVAISLQREGPGIRVRARSADGSETSRLVLDARALSAVTFGLLADIPREPQPAPGVTDDPLDYPPIDAPSPERATAPAPFDAPSRVSLSFSSGVRTAFPTTAIMAELELRADVVVHQWLLTVSLRAAPVAESTRVPFDADAYEETALAFGVGRELRVGRSAFELTAGPSLAYTWMEVDTPVLVSGEYAQLRLGPVARWGYPVSRRFRVTVTADGEVVPRALVNDHYQAGLPPFPTFTAGLRLGGEVAL